MFWPILCKQISQKVILTRAVPTSYPQKSKCIWTKTKLSPDYNHLYLNHNSAWKLLKVQDHIQILCDRSLLTLNTLSLQSASE